MGKEAIIAQLRKNKLAIKQLPGNQKNSFDSHFDFYEDFKKSLIKVGAKIMEVKDEHEFGQHVNAYSPHIIDFTKLDSWKMYSENCAKEILGTIETAILEGQFGVAENGAIWLDESNFPNRLIPFIAQKLIIKIIKRNIVSNMHDAYQKINLQNKGFGVFISGPSKTADIEQCLVYGAHGAIELTVAIVFNV